VATLAETGDTFAMGRALGVLVVLALASAAPAHADVLVFYGDLHAGGMYGKGLSGEQKDKAFFATAPNGVYGVSLAARLLFLGAQIQHHQYTNGSDLSTWTQLIAGTDIDADVGPGQDEHQSGFFTVGLGLGLGLGTGQQVDPPLSNDQITDKAFLVEGRIGGGKHFGKFVDLGVVVPVHWGYFLKSGNGAAANDLSTHYQGMGAEALLFLRLNLKVL